MGKVGIGMRPQQLFQGTSLLLLLLAIAGLYRMLALHAGSDLVLLAWLGLIGLAVWGLLANQRALVAAAGLALGLALTFYQRGTGHLPVSGANRAAELAALRRIDLSAVGYGLLLLFSLWRWWRQGRAAQS
jgi:hypothetical protein